MIHNVEVLDLPAWVDAILDQIETDGAPVTLMQNGTAIATIARPADEFDGEAQP